MLSFISEQHFLESKGLEEDANFLSDDWWLRDTAVVNHVVKTRGMWEIKLVFAHHKNPLKLICRTISSHSCRTKAETYAFYMKRQAAKDQRGTLEVTVEQLNICNN